jgi:hypothetical protein
MCILLISKRFANTAYQSIDDIIIISVKDGRHFFCTVSATLQVSELEEVQHQQRQEMQELEREAAVEAADAAGGAALDLEQVYASKDGVL